GRQADPTAVAGDVAGLAASVLAKAVTEFGAQVGLAPKPQDDGPTSTDAAGSQAPAEAPTPAEATGPDVATEAPAASPARPADETPPAPAAAEEPPPLPIAGYDNLTARQIVALLGELNPDQRARIRDHEVAGRNRKTVLAKLDRLDG
ncbi:MAG: hypothetical protein AAGK32_00350, partial [Actinomycetota bacterium]